MAADRLLSIVNSRPFRIAALVLVLLISFYIANPFAQSALARAQASGAIKENWYKWNSASQKAEQATGTHNVTGYENEASGPRMRQASMIYSSNDYNGVYERAVASHIRHGDRWGVPTHILRHDIVEAGFFNKPAYLLGLVIDELSKPYAQRAEWIVWFDADSILFNPEVPWNIFLPPPEFSHIHFLGTKDQNGFNAGMMFVRVDSWSVNMLAQTLTVRENHPDVPLDYADQSALAWVFDRPGYEEHVLYQPHNWWNSFGLQGKPFDHDRFVLHFAGIGCCGGEDKPPTMLRWLDLIDSEPDHFVKPLSELNLQAEIKEYWDTAISAQETLKAAEEWSKEQKYNGKAFQDARRQLQDTLLTTADDYDKLKGEISKLKALKDEADK